MMPGPNAIKGAILPAMYSQIFATIAPIFLCAAIGFGWARLNIPYEREFLSRLVLNVGVPALIISTLARVEIPSVELLRILTAGAFMLLITLSLAWLACRSLRLPVRTYLGPLSFPNTLNMGLPVTFFAFGEEGMAVSLGIYLVVSLAHFSLGVALVSGERSLAGVARSPVILSGLVASALVLTGTTLPLWLDRSLSLLGNMVIPLMLVTLGVSLSQLRIGDSARSAALGGLRLLLGFGAGYGVAELLGLEGTARGVLILQSSMPAAVFNYILAFNYQRSPEAVAGIVVSSTLMSFVCLPALLWFLK